MNKLIIAGFASSLLLSTPSWAHNDENEHNYSFGNQNCSVDFNYGVVVENNSIRFIENDNTVVQINDQSQLFVEGKEVKLTASQQAMVNEYASGINEQIPGIVNIAIDAVEIAFNAITHVVTGLGLEESDAGDRLDAVFANIKEKVNEKFNHDNGSYFLAEQNFDEFEQMMENELADEVEAIVSDSVGSILIAVGKAMNEEEGSFEEKMEAFGERMERMGENIELAVEDKAEKLGEQAEVICQNLKSLDKLEHELSDNVDALSDFDLINLSDEH